MRPRVSSNCRVVGSDWLQAVEAEELRGHRGCVGVVPLAAQKSGATDEFLAARDTAGWRPGEHHQIILDHTKSTYGVICIRSRCWRS